MLNSIDLSQFYTWKVYKVYTESVQNYIEKELLPNSILGEK